MNTNVCIRYNVYNLTGLCRPRVSLLVGDMRSYYLDLYITVFNRMLLIRVLNKNVYGGNRILIEPFIRSMAQ